MAEIKLTYFDIDGGRGEPIRLILHWGDLTFEDYRFPFAEFEQVRKNTPLNQVPVVEMNHQIITQSNALCRYFGKQLGLYPGDPWQAFLCDEVMEALEDATHKLVATFNLQGEALKQAREALVAGPLSRYLTWLEDRLKHQGGEFFADNQITVADFKVFVWSRALCSGHLDHIPTTLVSDLAPSVFNHMQRIGEMPKIRSWYVK